MLWRTSVRHTALSDNHHPTGYVLPDRIRHARSDTHCPMGDALPDRAGTCQCDILLNASACTTAPHNHSSTFITSQPGLRSVGNDRDCTAVAQTTVQVQPTQAGKHQSSCTECAAHRLCGTAGCYAQATCAGRCFLRARAHLQVPPSHAYPTLTTRTFTPHVAEPTTLHHVACATDVPCHVCPAIYEAQ